MSTDVDIARIRADEGTRSVSRDPGDFDEFVADSSTALLRTAYLLCGDRHHAEDLTQTTYAKVFSHWRRVSRADSPLAYARTVLTRTFISERRRRSSGETPTEVLPDGGVPPEDVPLRRSLIQALGELSQTDRAVLVLRYWEDHSVASTAAILGISESACRTRTSRALARIRTYFPDLED